MILSTHPTGRRAGLVKRRMRARAAILLALALLAARAPVEAQQAVDPTPGQPQGASFDGILRALDLKPKVAPAPDFVRSSRPADGGSFIPIGRSHPERTDKVMTPAEIQATTAALDSARVAQQSRAGVKPPAVPLKNAKGPTPVPLKTKVR
jgi:hypothetical protein